MLCLNVELRPPSCSRPAHLAAGEDAETAGALVVEETADEIFVVRLLRGLHDVLQRVGDVRFLKQREDELAAAPAGQVVQRQQTPAHPLQRANKDKAIKTPHLEYN